MSKSAGQLDLDGELIVLADHLTTNASDVDEPVRKSREVVCMDCTSRVTISLDGTCEWGHETDCEHHATLGGNR